MELCCNGLGQEWGRVVARRAALFHFSLPPMSGPIYEVLCGKLCVGHRRPTSCHILQNPCKVAGALVETQVFTQGPSPFEEL
jgi:hypothetical protein